MKKFTSPACVALCALAFVGGAGGCCELGPGNREALQLLEVSAFHEVIYPDPGTPLIGTTKTIRVSLNPPTTPPRQLLYESVTPSISEDGRLVAFASRDPNLAGNAAAFADGNVDPMNPTVPGLDVFIAEWATGVITPVSYIPGSIFGIGGAMGATTLAPAPPNTGESYYPYISASGEQVAFASRCDGFTRRRVGHQYLRGYLRVG